MGKSGIFPAFNMSKIVAMTKAIVTDVDQKTFVLLQRIGEEFANKARDIRTYHDHSANLRSSIGYIILHDGQVVDENFKKSGKGTDRTTGKNKGTNFAKEVGKDYPDGWVLIGVAGMEYAAYVERRKYDVITGSAPSESFVKKYFKDVFE